MLCIQYFIVNIT